MSATSAMAAGATAAVPTPSMKRNSTNHQGSAVRVKRNMARAYTMIPPIMTGLRPMVSLSQPKGDENSSVPR